jgi:S1-C subfamily serine protease
MRCFRSTIVAGILGVLSALGCAHQPIDPTLAHPELAVVRVANSGSPPVAGCGFIISSDGLVVTTSRIIAGGGPINVRLSDGRTLPAMLMEDDPFGDVAILKIPGSSYPFLHLAGDDVNPIMHIRVVSLAGVSDGVFDRWENSGAAIGFTARVSAADSGAPVLADSRLVIGVVREPSPTPASPQLATPIWHVVRMLPGPPE